MWCEVKIIVSGWSINLNCTCWSSCISKWQWQWLHPGDFLSESRFQKLTKLHRISTSLEILCVELWNGLLSRITDKKASLLVPWGVVAAGDPQGISVKALAKQASYIQGSAFTLASPGMETTKSSCYALATSPCSSKKHFPKISGVLSLMLVLQYRVPVEPQRKRSEGELWNRPTYFCPQRRYTLT